MFEATFDRNRLAETPCPQGDRLEDYLSHIRSMNESLSSESKSIFRDLKEGRIKHYQFRDLPVAEHLPPTAIEYVAELPKATYESEGIIGAASLELGTLFNYRETSTSLLYDIYPVKAHENSRSFVNSRRMLSFHTDGSAHPRIVPDFVLLFCVRDDPAAVNLFVDLDTLVGALSSDVVEVLCQPLFNHLVSQLPERYLLKPILYRAGESFTVRYDEDATFATTPEAHSAQSHLNQMLRRVAIEIKNHPNSLLVLNNTASLHARSSFAPRYDGTDRWIKGAFVTREDVRAGSIIALEL
jgi:L-asparagine oxygenase